MRFFEAVLATPVLQMAIFAAIGSSIASGIIGSYVVTKRIVSICGSLSHAVLSGLGCALWLQKVYALNWLQPVYGALIAAIVAALLIGWVHLRYREREDAIIAMIWSIGMAIGVVFVSQTPGYTVELMHFLLGNILWVSAPDLIVLIILDLVIISMVFLFHEQFLAICFDEKQARLQGIKAGSVYFLLLLLTALSIVILINIVGIILVLSMLALPPSIAGAFVRRLFPMMGVAIVLNLLFSMGGLALSYRLNWPAGATIALFSGFVYLLSLRFKRAVNASIP